MSEDRAAKTDERAPGEEASDEPSPAVPMGWPAAPMQLRPWIMCPDCRAAVVVAPEQFTKFFDGTLPTCPNCNRRIDWWRAVRSAVEDDFLLGGAASAIGANRTTFQITLTREKVQVMDFTQHGVPPSASVLAVNYTPIGREGGALFPAQVDGNSPVRHHFPLRTHILGRGAGADPPDECIVNVHVTWLAPNADETAISHLLDAVAAYNSARYDHVAVPANIAVESALAPAFADVIGSFCSKETTEGFLSEAATYSYQLRVLLPLVCHFLGVPLLAESIRGYLNRLRRLRNDIAHRGRLERTLEKSEAGDLLIAAVFGFHYAMFFREHVTRARADGRIPA